MINKIKAFLGSLWQNKEKFLSRLRSGLIRESLWGRAKRLLVCFDQFLNVLILNGREDETLSSRFYRWGRKGGFWHSLPEKIADTLLFFDYGEENGRKIGHCEKSYLNEINRTGLPVEMRS